MTQKLTMTGPRGLKIVATNPDDRIIADYAERIREAYARELQGFLEECNVAFRKLEPGATITLESRPIVVTIEKGSSE